MTTYFLCFHLGFTLTDVGYKISGKNNSAYIRKKFAIIILHKTPELLSIRQEFTLIPPNLGRGKANGLSVYNIKHRR